MPWSLSSRGIATVISSKSPLPQLQKVWPCIVGDNPIDRRIQIVSQRQEIDLDDPQSVVALQTGDQLFVRQIWFLKHCVLTLQIRILKIITGRLGGSEGPEGSANADLVGVGGVTLPARTRKNSTIKKRTGLWYNTPARRPVAPSTKEPRCSRRSHFACSRCCWEARLRWRPAAASPAPLRLPLLAPTAAPAAATSAPTPTAVAPAPTATSSQPAPTAALQPSATPAPSSVVPTGAPGLARGALTQRPIIVMIDNHPDAYPQTGLGSRGGGF